MWPAGLHLFFSPLSGRPARVERKMKIDLTETEVIHIMDSLRVRINDLRGEAGRCGFEESADLADELEELEHDLFEASARPGDWTDPISIAVCDAEINAETQMFNAGVDAREKMKATSRAAGRRALNFAQSDDSERSEMQDVDVWDANDPKNW
tara:strand:+ start:873 stop:1331 length:459 start_codon:yes stop_codon:yes gene_type:complete